MFRARKALTWLFVLVLTAAILTGCGKQDESPQANTPPASNQPAVTQSEMDQFRSSLNFAAAKNYEDLQGVPLYVGSTEIDNSRSLSGNVLTAAFNIMAQADEFTTFYDRELPNFGWDIVKREITDARIKFEATKSGRLATITGDIEDGKLTSYKVITD